jgi:hypothetical protein
LPAAQDWDPPDVSCLKWCLRRHSQAEPQFNERMLAESQRLRYQVFQEQKFPFQLWLSSTPHIISVNSGESGRPLLRLLRVRGVCRWTVQRPTFAVGGFLVVIVHLRDFGGPACVPHDHGSLALFFPRAGHSLPTACLRGPVARRVISKGRPAVSFTCQVPTKSLAAGLAKLVMAMAKTIPAAKVVALPTVVAFLSSEGTFMA